MALPLYLAMTAAEFLCAPKLPQRIAWMACHFSPYGTGISNLPKDLPADSIIILNDRTPIYGHDSQIVLSQLNDCVKSQNAACVLLDFQRPDIKETATLVKVLVSGLDCPVGVSCMYATGLDCPIFLPPVPLDMPVKTYLAPYAGREVWLEAALNMEVITLTTAGAHAASPTCGKIPKDGLPDQELQCHYTIEIEDSQARFSLYRTYDDLQTLLEAAQELGVIRAVGLYQELKHERIL